MEEADHGDRSISPGLLGCGVVGALVASHERVRHIVVEHGASVRLLRSAPFLGPIASFVCGHSDVQHFVASSQPAALIAAWPPPTKHLTNATVFPMPAAPGRSGTGDVENPVKPEEQHGKNPRDGRNHPTGNDYEGEDEYLGWKEGKKRSDHSGRKLGMSKVAALRLIFAGRLVPIKGLPILLNALSHVPGA